MGYLFSIFSAIGSPTSAGTYCGDIMQNGFDGIVELYVPRKCSSSSRIMRPCR
uniref:Small ribosomal subunit protein eS21 n=1 Tax=Parascaris univalens TaxID=6257 RepID=A0A914ZW55_PARUN